MSSSKNNSAFTLVELAIVIVIIGLITGGILGAQSLIASAKVNSAVTDIEKMGTGLKAFELEYNSLPGDLSDAYDYFGDDCGSNSTHDSSGCNGNGDKCIGGISSTCPAINWKYEGDYRRSLAHLNISGIIPNIPFSINSRSGDCTVGKVIPKIFNGIYMLYGDGQSQYVRTFQRASFSTQCRFSNYQVTTPQNIRKLDIKLDDGNGISGNFIGYSGNSCLSSSGIYNISNSNEDCGFMAKIN